MSTRPSAADARVVDCLGEACPVPVIELAKAIADVAVGQHVVVVADDAGAKVDIPVWCRMKQQQLVDVSDAGGGWSFRVCRAR